MKIAIVTGASSGMGREFVHQIAKRYRTIEEIWVIARREDRLLELKTEISNKIIKVIPLNLTNNNDIEKYENILESEKPEVRMLVNGAGYGKIGHFDQLSMDDNCGMIGLNCEALVKITHLTIPYMNFPSNIINIASSAAFLPQPSFAIYAATKSFVLSFSRALNVELQGKGIHVTAVCPGPVDTEFFDIAQTEHEVKLYKKMVMAKAPDVVSLALKDTYVGKDVSTYGIAMKGFNIITKCIPHKEIIKYIK